MKLKTKLSLFYFLYLGGAGIYYTFLSVFFKQELLMNEAQIGLFWTFAPILALISTPITGALADIYKNTKLIISLLTITAALLMASVNMLSGVAVIAALVAFEFCRAPIMPLTDSLIIGLTKQHNFRYSPVRTMGSLGWIVASVVFGLFINDSVGIIFLFAGITMMAAFLILQTVPNSSTDRPQTNYREDLKDLLRRKDYIIVLLILSATYALSNTINTYNGLRIVELGGTLQQVSLTTLAVAFFEIFILSQNEKLLNKFGFTNLFLFGAIVFFLRWVLNLYVVSVWGYVFVTSLHGIAFAVIFPTALNYIAKYLNEDISATAIALINTTYLITFSGLSSVIGFIYNKYSFDTVMYLYIGIGLLSFVFVYLFNRFKEDDDGIIEPLFKTERLIIRSFNKNDIDQFMIYRNNLEWMKYQGFKGRTKQEYTEALDIPFNIEEHSQIAIILKSTKKVIGDLYVKKTDNEVHIGYTINPKYKQLGYTYEATSGLIKFIQKNYPLVNIVSGVDKDNIPSINLLEKLGFFKTGEEDGEYYYKLKGTTEK